MAKKVKRELTRDVFIDEASALDKQKAVLIEEAQLTGDVDLIEKATAWSTNWQQGFGVNNANFNISNKVKSMLVDPMDFLTSFGYKDKPTKLTYEMLRRMGATPIAAAIRRTRIAQILQFCEPQQDEYTTGFVIRLRNRKAKVNKQNEKDIEFLTNFLLDGGAGGQKWGRDSFDAFVSKLVMDSLTFDQYTFEIVENKKGVPVEFVATDASSYRIILPASGDDQAPDPLTGQKCYPQWAQIFLGNVENTFYPWELCFGVRNPRSDLHVNGYGYAELEELVTTVTSFLWGDEYNRRAFSQGSAPKGILGIKGDISDEKLKEFKRQWIMQMAGVYNSWKTPIINSDLITWIDLQRTSKDMEYMAWLNLQIKIHSALFLIDPSEFGFDISRPEGTGGPLFEASNEERIKYSRDKGLTPILKNLARHINRHLIWRIDPRYEIFFAGIGAEDEDDVIDKTVKELSNWKTLDEVRNQFDLEILGDEKGGNLILNPNYMSWFNNQQLMKQQQEQQQQQQPDYGQEQGNYQPMDEDEGQQTEKAIMKGIVVNPFMKDLEKYVGTLKN